MPLAHYNLGNALLVKQEVGEAIVAFQRAISLKPDFAEALNNLGNALRKAGKLTRRPQHISGPSPRGQTTRKRSAIWNALKESGRLNEAIVAYQQAVQLKPGYAEGHNNLGNALTEAGRISEAIDVCKRAIDLNPQFAEAHSDLGNALKAQGQLDEAIVRYRTAIRIKPGYAEAINNLGGILIERGQLSEGIEACRSPPNSAKIR